MLRGLLFILLFQGVFSYGYLELFQAELPWLESNTIISLLVFCLFVCFFKSLNFPFSPSFFGAADQWAGGV